MTARRLALALFLLLLPAVAARAQVTVEPPSEEELAYMQSLLEEGRDAATDRAVADRKAWEERNRFDSMTAHAKKLRGEFADDKKQWKIRMAEDLEKSAPEHEQWAERWEARAKIAEENLIRLRNELIRVVDQVYFGKEIHGENGPEEGEPKYSLTFCEYIVDEDGTILLGEEAFRSPGTVASAKGAAFVYRAEMRKHQATPPGAAPPGNRHLWWKQASLLWQVENAGKTGVPEDRMEKKEDDLRDATVEIHRERERLRGPGGAGGGGAGHRPAEDDPGRQEGPFRIWTIDPVELEEGKEPEDEPEDEPKIEPGRLRYSFKGNGTTDSVDLRVENTGRKPVWAMIRTGTLLISVRVKVQVMLVISNPLFFLPAGKKGWITVRVVCVQPKFEPPAEDVPLYDGWHVDLSNLEAGPNRVVIRAGEQEKPEIPAERVRPLAKRLQRVASRVLAQDACMFERRFFRDSGHRFMMWNGDVDDFDESGRRHPRRLDPAKRKEEGPRVLGPYEKAWRARLKALEEGAVPCSPDDPITEVEIAPRRKIRVRGKIPSEERSDPRPADYASAVRTWTVRNAIGSDEPPRDELQTLVESELKKQGVDEAQAKPLAKAIADEVMDTVEGEVEERAQEYEKVKADLSKIDLTLKLL